MSEQGAVEEILTDLAPYLTVRDLTFIADSIRPIEPIEDEHAIRQRELAELIEGFVQAQAERDRPASSRSYLDAHMDLWLQRIGKMDAHAAALYSIKLLTDFIDDVSLADAFEEHLAEVLQAEENAAQQFAAEEAE